MGLGNKLLNGKIREKIGIKIANKLEKNSVSIKDIETEEFVNVTYKDNEEHFISKIKDGYIYSSFGLYFDNKKRLIRETIAYRYILSLKQEIGGKFAFYKLRKRKTINDNAFSVQSIWNLSFAHWLFETLPRLFILKDSGLADKIDTIILGDSCNKKFHKESLSILGFDNKKIVYISDEMEIKVNNMYISSHPSIYIMRPPKWICQKYNQIAEGLSKKNQDKYFPKKVYLQRKNVKTRRLLNENELIELISKYGYETICPEEHSLEYQFCLAYNADKIISIVGSGLSSLVCSKNTVSVLGIEPYIRPEYDNWSFILEQVGGKYYYYTEKNEKNFKFHNIHNKNNDFDFYIDINKFGEQFKLFENDNQ